MIAMTPEQARDTAAIAAYGAWTGEGLERVLSDWALLPPAGRADWRAVADAVRMTVEAQSLDQTQQPQPAPELAAELDQLRDRLATLAASLDADALATQPSKKSQIQADAARRIREALA